MKKFYVEVEMVNGSVHTTTVDAAAESKVFETLLEAMFLGYLEIKSFNGTVHLKGDNIISIRVTNRESMVARFTSVSTIEPRSKVVNALDYVKRIFGR